MFSLVLSILKLSNCYICGLFLCIISSKGKGKWGDLKISCSISVVGTIDNNHLSLGNAWDVVDILSLFLQGIDEYRLVLVLLFTLFFQITNLAPQKRSSYLYCNFFLSVGKPDLFIPYKFLNTRNHCRN